MAQRAREYSPRALTVAGAAGAILLAAGASVAHADIFGGDVAVLTSIFHTSLKQLDELRSVTDLLARGYTELRRVAQYAGDTKQAFQDFQRLDGNRTLTSGVRSMDGVFPGAAFVGRDAESASRSGTAATGNLSADLRSCIDSLVRTPGRKTPECEALRRDATVERIQASLAKTYGPVPQGRSELVEARAEEVATERGRLLGQAKMALVSADATSMLTRCRDATESVLCQRMAAEAGIKSYEQQAETNRKLDDLLRGQAVANELRIAEERRALQEEEARRSALVSGLPASTLSGLGSP